MTKTKLHANEVDIDRDLVKNLLRQQFSHWSELALELIEPEGTDNVMYRLGDDKVVRLPRMTAASENIEKEIYTLPKLEPSLPIKIPALVNIGKPNDNYPYQWMICSHLKGTNPSKENKIDYSQAAVDLGNFIIAMHNINTQGDHKCSRGKSLKLRDMATQNAIKLSTKFFDTNILTKVWDTVLNIPSWQGDPVWIHGDLHPGNLLAKDGKITAIVDFGLSGVGDPAVDLMVAWTLLDKTSREVFRSTVKPDNATWERSRGWALTFGVVAYIYYIENNSSLAAIAKRTVDEIIADNQ